MIYTEIAGRIEAWLVSRGVRVTRCPLDSSGLFAPRDPDLPWDRDDIFIARDLDPVSDLLTLVHEAGHWVGHSIRPGVDAIRAEYQAYVYGWRVLRLFGAPVSRRGWRRACARDHREFLARQGGAS